MRAPPDSTPASAVEAVADAPNGQEVAWLLWVTLELGAKLLNEVVDRPRRPMMVGPPHPGEDLVSSQGDAASLKETLQDVELRGRDLEGLPAARHRTRR